MSFSPALLAVLCAARVHAQDDAMAVLRRSLAGAATPYQGQALVETRAGGVLRRSLVDVVYESPQRYRRDIADGRGFLVASVVAEGGREWVYDRRRRSVWRGEPADPDYKLIDPDEELALLARNYELRRVGREEAAGRLCDVVEVRARRGGRVVQRLWLDQKRGMALRRRNFGPDGAELSSMRYLRVAFPARVDAESFAFRVPPGARMLDSGLRPDYLALEEAASATGLVPRPPAWLPPGYIFESVNVLPHKGATILHYRYSDGMDVLSLFQYPRRVRLASEQPAQPAALRRGPARLSWTPDGTLLEWEDGEGFALLGRMPLEELRRVADSVPGGGR
ncbi:MAG TPA: sigma-E factor regulatory protein RseB domain-containing protein [Elusimicrobiota bacterium]|jgi:outer membrane lipoprotein-sorting protein|nr:sigma-E factor regulatory protein RseB domain-containing protein [Elusimicrobiota bacterium]